MINLKVMYHGEDFELNLPTKFEEVDMNYLASLVDNVEVANNYSLIAILFKQKPYAIVSSIKQGKNSTVAAVPVMIKSGNCDSTFIKDIALGSRLSVAPSDIALGYHVSSSYNSLNPNLLVGLTKENPNLYKDTLPIDEEVYFVDFKIIPNVNIHAAISNSKPIVDCYFKEVGGSKQ